MNKMFVFEFKMIFGYIMIEEFGVKLCNLVLIVII